MDTMEKLTILANAAKYDVACTSSGVQREAVRGSLGSAAACGICHSFSSDGRCISLLKVLQTNYCVYDCQYCVNRKSSDIPRAALTPREVADITINFYKRNYIEGLFLSSAVIRDPNYTMEMLCNTVTIIRNEYRFNGYIHVKAIPGADRELLVRTAMVADRMSVNIELPTEQSLSILAPDKTKHSILEPMKLLKGGITQSREEVALFHHAPRFVPGGQATQLIVGATPDSDKKIVHLAEGLYKNYNLKRVFYSAYTPVATTNKLLPTTSPPLLREHRLYQADWLIRFYGFKAAEILRDENENLSLNLDPKCHWALKNLEIFPVEVNKADYDTLLRVPGIGMRSARRIVDARKIGRLDFTILKKIGVVLKRAKYFITCDGRMSERISLIPEILEMKLTENKINEAFTQLSLLDGQLSIEDRSASVPSALLMSPSEAITTEREERVKCLTGEM